MLRRRDCEGVIGMALHFCKGARVRRHHLAHMRVEAFRPLEAAISIRPVNAAKVVNDVAAGKNEHAALAQWRQACAKINVVLEWRARMDRQLQHWDVGSREDVCQY